MSREVIVGENGLASGKSGDLAIADCSTISPSDSRRMAVELERRGIEFLDAPCSGSNAGAEGATLTFMIGGKESVYKKLMPYFEPMGKNFYYSGGNGMGLQAKLSQSMILGNLLQAFNGSFVLSTKGGVDANLMLEIINNSAARSGLVALKAPVVFARNFDPNFSVKWLEKDMTLMLESAVELNVPAPLTGLCSRCCGPRSPRNMEGSRQKTDKSAR